MPFTSLSDSDSWSVAESWVSIIFCSCVVVVVAVTVAVDNGPANKIAAATKSTDSVGIAVRVNDDSL